MRNVSEQSWQWEGVVPVCCGAPFAARLLLRYLIMKNKQPWGTLNFHKTITAFLNPSAPSSSNQRRREMDRRTAKKKKKRVTDKQSTNKQKVRRSDGVTVLRLLPRWHHPATTKNLMLLYFKCTIIHNYTHESAAYPFSQTISEDPAQLVWHKKVSSSSSPPRLQQHFMWEGGGCEGTSVGELQPTRYRSIADLVWGRSIRRRCSSSKSCIFCPQEIDCCHRNSSQNNSNSSVVLGTS